jgi:hypothetical protein
LQHLLARRAGLHDEHNDLDDEREDRERERDRRQHIDVLDRHHDGERHQARQGNDRGP